MEKRGKINIKFYANTELKPFILGDVELFPLYVRVGYRRKNTKFKFMPELFVQDELTDNIDSWITLMTNGKFDLRKEINLTYNIIEGIIRYEEEKLGDDFKLKGLGDRIKIYKVSLIRTLEDGLTSTFQFFSRSVLTVNQFEQIESLQFADATAELSKRYGQSIIDKILFHKIGRITSISMLTPQMFNFTFVSALANKTKSEDISVYDWLIKGKRQEYLTFIQDFENQIKDDDKIKSLQLVGRFTITKEQFLDINFKELVSVALNFPVNNLIRGIYGDNHKIINK